MGDVTTTTADNVILSATNSFFTFLPKWELSHQRGIGLYVSACLVLPVTYIKSVHLKDDTVQWHVVLTLQSSLSIAREDIYGGVHLICWLVRNPWSLEMLPLTV